MNLWRADKVMDRMNEMLDHVLKGESPEKYYDETKMSMLESKLYKYMISNQVSKQQLREQQNHIAELISDISHQTKTPIANLMLYSELLMERNEMKKDKELSDMVSALYEQTQKLSFLIQSMVTISRLENGIIRTSPTQNDILPLVKDSVNQMMQKAAKKSIEIKIKENIPQIQAFFDAKWTKEALCNILDNAIKYTKEGGCVEISVTSYQLFVKIDIKDNGIGIPEWEQSRIFARFYRGESVQQEEGVGLGLYLAREIIAGEDGYIKLQSKVGEGSVFSVFLLNEKKLSDFDANRK